MIPTIKIDMTAFNRSLAEYIKEDRRDLAEIVNSKMFWILKGARDATPMASRAEILKALGGEDVAKFSKKVFGPVRGHGVAKGSKNAYALLAYWAKKKGWAIPYKKRAAKAKALIGRRLAAIGKLKVGWNLPLKKFAAIAKEFLSISKEGGAVKQRGQAKPATPGWNPIATAEYSLAVKKGDAAFQIDPRVEAALGISFQKEAASMAAKTAERMARRLAKYK